MALIEQGVAPGGGAWLGGQLFSAMCVSTQRQPVVEPGLAHPALPVLSCVWTWVGCS